MEVDANKVTKLCANLWPYVSEFCGTLGSLVVQLEQPFGLAPDGEQWFHPL